MSVKGYKVFNPDWTCRGFQYEVGKTFEHDGNIEMCGTGFHFCQKILSCFNYYDFNSNNKVAEVEAIGRVETRGDKSVTDKIVIIRELTWHEVLDLVNTGKNCVGYGNSGNHNNGNCNSNDFNNGHHNSGYSNNGSCNNGDYNSGNWNSGYRNCGVLNTGSCNNGDCNSGYANNGNGNSGDWNSTNFSTGFFNSNEQPLYIFNKPANISRDDFNSLPAVIAMRKKYKNNWWVYSKDMTDEEKMAHPEYETTGGYLKTVDSKTAYSIMWSNMTEDERMGVKDIPNFDEKVFEEITGIVID